MSLGKLLTTIFVVFLLPGNVFAEGSKFDRFATDAEATTQLRDDVGLTPANIPYIKAAEANATIKDTLTLKNGTDTHKIKAVGEPGLGGRLTIGLDETARTIVICDSGDVDTDFGLAAANDPKLIIMNAALTAKGGLDASSLVLHNLTIRSSGGIAQFDSWGNAGWRWYNQADVATGDMFTFDSAANIELTDTNAEQSWLYVEPKINQSATAAYNGLKIKVTETSLGDASTGDGGGTNNLILAGTSTDPDMFKVDNVGRICVAESSSPSALADHVYFYGKDVAGTAEAFAADAAANEAQLTAHNDKNFDPDPNERYPWMPYYKNNALGVDVGFDMSRALRDLQALTGTRYIHYRDVPKTIDLEKTQKVQWIRNYIESNTQEVEVLKTQALESFIVDEQVFYEFEVPYLECDGNGTCVKKTKIVKQGVKIRLETVGYEFINGEVKEKTEIIWETKKVNKFRLKEDIRFSEIDGKFYSTVKPTQAEAIAAAEKGFKFDPPKWLNDRLTKISSIQEEK